MKNSDMRENDVFKVDTYNVKDYEEKRVVDLVSIVHEPSDHAKIVLVYIPSLMASCLVPVKELKQVDKDEVEYFSLENDKYKEMIKVANNLKNL